MRTPRKVLLLSSLICLTLVVSACCPELDHFQAAIHTGDPLKKAFEIPREFRRAHIEKVDAYEYFDVEEPLRVFHAREGAELEDLKFKSAPELADYLQKQTLGNKWKATFNFAHFPIRMRVDATIGADGRFTSLDSSMPDD